MKVSLNKADEDSSFLTLDGNNELKYIKTLGYNVYLQNKEEYSNIENIITDAVIQEIDVHQIISNFERLTWDCNKILANYDIIVIFSTMDESKFEALENIIKEIMITNKRFLH